MRTLLQLLILSVTLVLFQACAKKPAEEAKQSNERAVIDPSKLAGSCKTNASEACADYVSETGAAALKPKLKEKCESGDDFGAGMFSESACTSSSTRVGRCKLSKTDSGSGVVYTAVINYYASMNLSASQIESACTTIIKGTFQAD